MLPPRRVEGEVQQMDDLLARVARNHSAHWPAKWGAAEAAGFVERATYHGITGIIAAREELLQDFPATVVATIEDRARSFAMWEVRHRALLRGLTDVMADQGLEAILLKGSALAYDLYPNPAWRERADSDLLVPGDERAAAAAVLQSLGFAPAEGDTSADSFLFQQCWSKTLPDGTAHSIDLHFEPFNMASFRAVAGYSDALRGKRCLTALGPHAVVPSRAFLLFHAALHRLVHVHSPYFDGGRAHYGADRLVWLMDIDLLARALDEFEWAEFVRLAVDRRQARACLDGLMTAERIMSTPLPAPIVEQLGKACDQSSTYFDLGRIGRAWADFRSAGSAPAKARYLLGRIFPGRGFMRSKYPAMSSLPIAMLYARRIAEFALPRRRSS